MTKEWNPPYVLFDGNDVETEHMQCADEGRALTAAIEDEFHRLRVSDLRDAANQQGFLRLLDEAQKLPFVAD